MEEFQHVKLLIDNSFTTPQELFFKTEGEIPAVQKAKAIAEQDLIVRNGGSRIFWADHVNMLKSKDFGNVQYIIEPINLL